MLLKRDVFIAALESDDYKVLEKLLEEGCSPDFPISTRGNMSVIIKRPIHIARSPQTIQLLLRFGADPNEKICFDEVINQSYESVICYRVRDFLRKKPFYRENIMALLSYQPFLIDTIEINKALNYLISIMKPGEPLQEYQRMLICSSADLEKKTNGKYGGSPLKHAQKSKALLSAMVCHNFPLHYQIMTGSVKDKYELPPDIYEEYEKSEAAKLMRILAIWPLITVLWGEEYAFPKELLRQIKCFIVAELDLHYPLECPFIFKYLDLAALMPLFERVYTLLDNRVLHFRKKRGVDKGYSPIFFEKVMDAISEKKPYGRSGFAWQLTQKYRHQCSPENPLFMNEVLWFTQKKRFKFSLKPQQEKTLALDEKKEDSLSSS